jgi:LysR family cyn operon transcriptional activator
MEMRHLRYFLAVADSLHFTRAAEHIHISQPSLSQQIKQLEEEVGTPLFDRIGKRVQLTEAGTIFREHACRALREMEEALAAIEELEGLERGLLTIGVVQTVNAYLMPDVIARFSRAHPQIALRVEELAAGEIEHGLAEGRLDAGVGFMPASDARVASEPLLEEDLVLIVPKAHRLSRRQLVPMSELDNEPLVLLPSRFCTRRLIEDSLRTARARLHVAIEMNSIEGILAMVRTGRLATVLPRLALRKKSDSSLHAIPLSDPTPRRKVGLLWRVGSYRSAAARALAQEIRTVVQEQDNGPLRPSVDGGADTLPAKRAGAR